MLVCTKTRSIPGGVGQVGHLPSELQSERIWYGPFEFAFLPSSQMLLLEPSRNHALRASAQNISGV